MTTSNSYADSLSLLTTVGHVNASLGRALGTPLSVLANDMVSAKMSCMLDFVGQTVSDEQRYTFNALFPERSFSDVDQVRVASALLDGWLNGILASWPTTVDDRAGAGQYV